MALTNKLTAIANAIRAKTGKTEPLTLDQMPTEIASISGGGGSSSGDGSPFVIKKVINIGAKVSVTGEKYYTYALYNGVRLPRIPDSVRASYPYAWIRLNAGEYQMIVSATKWYYSSGKMYLPTSTLNKKYTLTNSSWVDGGGWTDSGAWPINTLIWSSHDIPNGSADATDIYFVGSEPVPID